MRTVSTPRLNFSHVSYTAQAHLPTDGTFHSGLGPSVFIINQENAPTEVLTG